ncbi:hypothetical protein P7K49_012746 [Saguinus oedipus]|uniref:N-acetyltransferase domain-containing protein n=1 Tax=Saguinus oedipus TaxID=9490 RepID=A0ABQ9VE81_SAGOE|nr:hypothetical protein P7K49_012746 [Saguinus oedipus]
MAQYTVVAVYIKESWWSTEDAIRTSDPAREGLMKVGSQLQMKVQSFGERIVLFILNVIIFGRLERNLDDDDVFFLPHSMKEQAKILWRHGAAVGFYTSKMKGISGLASLPSWSSKHRTEGEPVPFTLHQALPHRGAGKTAVPATESRWRPVGLLHCESSGPAWAPVQFRGEEGELLSSMWNWSSGYSADRGAWLKGHVLIGEMATVLVLTLVAIWLSCSLCGSGTGACYLLPVFDTVFVRRKHRRQGLGTAMLRDFCETFPDDEALGGILEAEALGSPRGQMQASARQHTRGGFLPSEKSPIAAAQAGTSRLITRSKLLPSWKGPGLPAISPLSSPAKKVLNGLILTHATALWASATQVSIEQFLLVCPEERGRLWEVKSPGAWGQRINIWLKKSASQQQLLLVVQCAGGKTTTLAHPGNSEEEDVSHHARACWNDRPRQSAPGDSSKERMCGEELEDTKNDRDRGAEEEDTGLVGQPQGKLTRPSL